MVFSVVSFAWTFLTTVLGALLITKCGHNLHVSLLQTKILNIGWYMIRNHSHEENVKEAMVHVKISTEWVKRWNILCSISMHAFFAV